MELQTLSLHRSCCHHNLSDPHGHHNKQASSSLKAKREIMQHQLQPFPIHVPRSSLLCISNNSRILHALQKGIPTLCSVVPLLHYPIERDRIRARASQEHEILPNALRRMSDPLWRGGYSLGVDLGLSKTGLALSKGFFPRPLTVLELRGQKLELQLIEIAGKQEVDEFIIGLPKSRDGKETQQSNKVRSFASRFAVRAAERGQRVFLQDEHGTSAEALDVMINMGLRKHARRGKIDSYAAVMVLERYIATSGRSAELVLPKQPALQEMLRRQPLLDPDFFPDE
ncbi:hypothetical protein AAC387_Pa05g2630 [Persea americana]